MEDASSARTRRPEAICKPAYDPRRVVTAPRSGRVCNALGKARPGALNVLGLTDGRGPSRHMKLSRTLRSSSALHVLGQSVGRRSAQRLHQWPGQHLPGLDIPGIGIEIEQTRITRNRHDHRFRSHRHHPPETSRNPRSEDTSPETAAPTEPSRAGPQAGTRTGTRVSAVAYITPPPCSVESSAPRARKRNPGTPSSAASYATHEPTWPYPGPDSTARTPRPRTRHNEPHTQSSAKPPSVERLEKGSFPRMRKLGIAQKTNRRR